MKAQSLICLVSIFAARAWSSDTYAPIRLPADRYAAMSEKSPFALATPIAATSPQASFATNWFVSGVARIGDVDLVTIKSRDLSTMFSLYGHESVGGVSLASVNWSEVVGKSTVVLRKGTETAKIEFNEEDVRATPTATIGPPPPSPAPQANDPGVVPAATVPAPVAAQNPSAVQRRIRIINQPR